MNDYFDLSNRLKQQPLNGLKSLTRLMGQEGMVLLKNDGVLPIVNQKVNLYGRIMFDYYQSGTGSGGLVNVSKKYSFIEAIKMNPLLEINESLLTIYETWVKDNPFNSGNGMWASEPWSQLEMTLDEDIAKKAQSFSETSIIFIGRTAGEDKDNSATAGSYYLSAEEEVMLKNVSEHSKKTVVVLNVGNTIDLSFIDKYKISAVLLAYHGGQTGALATIDLITGLANPSGKLTTTICNDLKDYPSNDNFGRVINHYSEDIYLGYRHFYTFKTNAVRYPFGYGLSYTTFSNEVIKYEIENLTLKLWVRVTNTGSLGGKTVIQCYFEPPQGLLGAPKLMLLGFKKTKLLKVNEDSEIFFELDLSEMKRYDETGKTGHESSFVIEQGDYQLFLGESSNQLSHFYTHKVDKTFLIESLGEAMRPVVKFKRIKPFNDNGLLRVQFEAVPLRTKALKTNFNLMKQGIEIPEKPVTLLDVHRKSITLDMFVETLSEQDLICLSRGEGMSSPKVTPGTASAFGGLTASLKEKGIPIMCAADGPSGIRMDSGYAATSIPIGTLLASSFNEVLVSDLYYGVALEMQNYDIELLLAPGMNIIRHPLNGRNFEYFSEDPLVTGLMAKAVIDGLDRGGVTGSLKHFCCNNQEYMRFDSDALVSERALREIYLKGYEIAIKQSNVKAIMTAYNPINGNWAASNFDLNTTILRNQWGYDGIVITDWWAKMNDDQGLPSKENTAMMIKAQNDIYMVVRDSLSNSSNDNTKEMLDEGVLSIEELKRNASNILRFILNSNTFQKQFDAIQQKGLIKSNIKTLQTIILNNKKIDSYSADEHIYHVSNKQLSGDLFLNELDQDSKIYRNNRSIVIKKEGTVVNITSEPFKKALTDIDFEALDITNYQMINDGPFEPTIIHLKNIAYKTDVITYDQKDKQLKTCLKNELVSYPIEIKSTSKYIVEIKLSSNQSELAQMPFSVLINNEAKQTITSNGTNGQEVVVSAYININEGKQFIGLKFNKTGLNIHEMKLIRHY
ncbi:MAG TPA: glycoside hydrolase family 3 N-terminal domain-containing protein [Acholeplasma sp.]|nr:glycoside hydrolase family 3 N-terminal domain-containing protein [Acholeplasma sp.]